MGKRQDTNVPPQAPAAHCEHCGASLRSEARFCVSCGAGNAAPTDAPVERTRSLAGPIVVVVCALVTVAVFAGVLVLQDRDASPAATGTTVETAADSDQADANNEGNATESATGSDEPEQGDDAAATEDVDLPPLDLQNLTLPPTACSWVTEYGELPDPLQLINGAVPFPDSVYPYVQLTDRQPPQMVDLDGDGVDEGLIALSCNAGGSGVTDEIHVFAADGSHLDGFTVGDGVEGRPNLDTLTIDGGTLTITTFGTYPGEALCCGTLPVTDTYSFDSRRLEQIDRVTG